MSESAQAGTDSTDAGGTQSNASSNPTGDTSTTLTADSKAADTKPAAAATPDATKPNANANGDAKTDDKPAGDKKPDDTKVEDKPVEYKFDLPKDVNVDQDALAKFTDLAKDLKLAPDAAQKVLNFEVARQKAAAEAHVAQVKQWGEDVAADKELGKPENQALARKAIEQFGSPELKSLLDQTGFGNHPALVKLMYRIGKAISEDKVIVGRGDAPAAPKDPAQVLYPNQA